MDIGAVSVDNDGQETDMDSRVRKHFDHLTGEHRLGDAGQLFFALLFAAVWGGDTFFLRLTTVSPDYLPSYLKLPLGLAFCALSAVLAARGMTQIFGDKKPASGVVATGVYRHVRHPIYLAEILVYLGLLILSLSLAAAAVAAAAAVFLHFISRHEEKLLLRRFGREYADYMKNVPMWIPRPRKQGDVRKGA